MSMAVTPTNISSLWDGPPMLNGCYKHFVPTGRFPRLYDCATNVPSLWDGFLRSTIVLQTFRPAGTVSYVLRLCYKHSVPTGRSPDVERIFYKHSVPLGRFPRLYDCATNVPSRWDCFLRSMIVLHIWSRWDRLVADLRSVRNGNFGG